MLVRHITVLLLIGVLVHASFCIWGLSHNRAIGAAANRSAHAVDRVATILLPSSATINHPLGCIASNDSYFTHWQSEDRPITTASVLTVPLVIPTVGADISIGDGMHMTIPAIAASLVIWIAIAVAIADRYCRQTQKQSRAGSSCKGALDNIAITLAANIWVPVALAFALAFWNSLPGQVQAGYLTTAATSRWATLGVVAGFIAVYPITLLYLRWRRHAAANVDQGQRIACLRCGYPLGGMNICPECGTHCSEKAKPALRPHQRRWLAAVTLAIPALLLTPLWISWIDIAIDHLTTP